MNTRIRSKLIEANEANIIKMNREEIRKLFETTTTESDKKVCGASMITNRQK